MFLIPVCVCAESLSHVRLFVTPRTIACQTPLFMGFLRQEYQGRWPFPSPGDLPDPEIEPASCALQQILYHLSHQGSFNANSIIQFDEVQ